MTPDQQKEFFKQSFTLKGRIFYPNLFVAKAKEAGKREQYECQFAFKPEDNQAVLEKIAAFLQTAKGSFHPTVPMEYWVNPLKKYETYKRMDGKPNPDHLKGHYWVNATSGKDFKPQVVDANRQPILNEAEVYSGRNAAVNIKFYLIKSQKQGLSTNLEAVMLLDGGDKVGGSGQADINKIFGGFAADAGISSAAPASQEDWTQTKATGSVTSFV